MGATYKKAISIILVMFMVVGAFNGLLIGGEKAYAAVQFAGGTGTIADPYQIATAAQLNEIRYNMRASFKLIDDIDLSTYAVGEGWMPIGDNDDIFRGTLDGNGYKIKNLVIHRPTTDYVGLFGVTAYSEIRNIALENINVKGRSYTGGLVGDNNTEGAISNSSVSGNVLGSNESGGLAGRSQGTINTSYMTGNVSGTTSVGGLVGQNFGTINSSYATGITSGLSKVGGLAGESYMGTIKTSYAIGLVSGLSDLGGLVGVKAGGEISKSFYDSESTLQDLGDSGKGIGKSTTEMMDISTYSDAGWDMSGKWDIDPSLNNGYPYLNFASIVQSSFAGGTGSANNPYQVANAAQLNELRYHSSSETYFIQVADIDLSTYASGEGWMPIGYYEDRLFGGNLDGNGFIIRNLTINRPDTNHVGLFSFLAYSQIKNVVLEDVHVTGGSSTGGLVGNNQGTISYSSVTGSVYGEDSVGGLVGMSLGVINNSYSTASVYGKSSVGGMVGSNQNNAGFSNNYATGSVQGESSVGGLVGTNHNLISNSYAIGSVSGLTEIGGLVGSNGNSGTITSSVYNSDITGHLDNTNKGVGKLTEEMKNPITYSDLDWDMSYIWGVHSSINNGYPYLNKLLSATIVGVTKPVAGAMPVTSIPETDQYTTTVTWSIGNTPFDDQTPFAASTTYTATITLTPKLGYGLTGVTQNFFKVARATATNSANAGVIRARFGATETVISTSDILGVTVPVTGATPIATLTDTAAYRAAITWSPVHATFVDSETYTATITLTPRSGYTLLGVPEDFFQVSGALTTNAANAGAITAVFPSLPDITIPVITLLGAATVNLTNGASYTDAGATALDNVDGDLTEDIVVTISNNVNAGTTLNTAVAGTYTYHYNVSDTAGNAAQEKIRTVVVASTVNTPTPTSTPPTNVTVTSTNGALTLPVGRSGEVSIPDEVKVYIPAGATDKEFKLTIEKVLNTKGLLTNGEDLASPIYEILKNFSGNFSKPVTLTFVFDPASLKSSQRAAVFYYDEVHKVWVEVGGKVSGHTITVEVNHFTKFAVMAVDQGAEATTEPVKVSFSDISGHWAESGINQAVSRGIVKGYLDGTFKPGHTVTRAEFSVMLMNALKRQDEGTDLTFTDTAMIGDWAKKAIAQAVQAGIISGYADHTFRPNAQITRSEMAVMINKALGHSIEANAITGFADDKDIPAWAKISVAYMRQAGIMSGKGDNQFAPQVHATRAESVTVLLNMLARKQ